MHERLLSMPKQAVYRWLLALLITAISIVVSYEWLDRPVSMYMSTHTRPLALLPWTVELHRNADELALIAIIVCGIIAIARPGKRPRRVIAMLFLTGLSIIVVRAMKDQLQLVFGRTWPETWVEDNPSLIGDGVYTFNLMHGGEAYESFPSGTTATICAVFGVAWWWYPRWRLVYSAVIGVVVFTLVTSNYHFVSDIIGGAFVAFSVGWFATKIWDSWGPGHTRVAESPAAADQYPAGRETQYDLDKRPNADGVHDGADADTAAE